MKSADLGLGGGSILTFGGAYIGAMLADSCDVVCLRWKFDISQGYVVYTWFGSVGVGGATGLGDKSRASGCQDWRDDAK